MDRARHPTQQPEANLAWTAHLLSQIGQVRDGWSVTGVEGLQSAERCDVGQVEKAYVDTGQGPFWYCGSGGLTVK